MVEMTQSLWYASGPLQVETAQHSGSDKGKELFSRELGAGLAAPSWLGMCSYS
jgi:hypothetical protein